MKSKRSNTYYMMAWLLTMLCAACVGDELTDQNDPSMVPVTLSSQLPQTGDTRAAASLDLNGNSFEAGQDVLVRISRSGENVYKDYVYTTGENGVMNLPAVSPPYYPLDNAKIDIKSFHPTTAINGSHTVASDQTTAEGYVASDLMVAVNKTNVAKTASNVELRYYHMLGKITLTVIPGKGVKRIKTVKLKNVKPTVTFDVNSLTTSSTFTAGGDPVDVTVVKTLNDDIADKATVQGTAVIPVQNVYVEVEVVLDDDSESVVVSSQTVNGNNGYKNYYEITVNGPKINVSLSASKEWNADKKYFKNCSPVLTFNVGGELFNMVCVQGGGKTGYYAQYGSNPSSSQCRMKHDFYIGQTEVTQALWTAVMGSNPAYFSDDRNKPVARV